MDSYRLEMPTSNVARLGTEWPDLHNAAGKAKKSQVAEIDFWSVGVRAVTGVKTAQRASLAELDALFATLQHRAFRGEF